MVDICLITDNLYADHTYVCVKSLLFSKDKRSDYNVHVVFDVDELEFSELKDKFSKLAESHFKVECVRVSSEKYNEFEIVDFHVKAASLLKFDLVYIFPKIDKLLYIDCDITVNKDVTELFNTDLEDNYFAANYHAKSPDEIKHRESLSLKHVYNTGVVLFNLKKMREDNLYNTLMETRKTNAYILKARSLDQLTFNFVCKDKIKEFDPKHHLMFRSNWSLELYNKTYNTNYYKFESVIDDATIIHYVGKDCKPWFKEAKANELWQYYKYNAEPTNLNVYNNTNYMSLKPLSKKVIVFSFDNNVIDQAIVALYSLLDNAKEGMHIVCLITNDVCLFHRVRIYNKLNSLNRKFYLSFVDVGSVLNKDFREAFVIRGITCPAYFRLFMDKLLPNFKKVIYSDIDVIFKKDAFDAFKFVKGNKPLYAVPSVNLLDRSQKTNDEWKYYFNSGFLVMNIEQLKKLDRTRAVESLVSKNLTFQDQDILNEVFVGEIGRLPPTFCFIPSAYLYHSGNKYTKCVEKGLFSLEEVNNLTNPYIIHFAGTKPWEDKNIGYASEWFIYHDKIFEKLVEKVKAIRNANTKCNVTREELSNIIGKEHLIKRIAGIKANALTVDRFAPSCVVRSFDTKSEVVFKNRQDFIKAAKIKELIALKKISPIVLIEQYMPGAFDVSVSSTLKVFSKDMIDSNSEYQLIEMADKLFKKYPQFLFIDFLIVGKNIYFKRFRDE